MRTFDFAPLLGASIGFDSLFNLQDRLKRQAAGERAYPPYDIQKTSEDTYRITLALAGFNQDDIEISLEDQALVISAQGPNDEEEDEDQTNFLFRGIARRAFERRFQLADFIRVKNASFKSGLLHINLEREIPEHMRPRRIEISGSGRRAITGKKKAA